jgi:uncharacterized protein (DUF952 family)
MILFLKYTHNNEPLIGAEIGVASGLNAESILKTLPMKKLYLIDPCFDECAHAEALRRLKGFLQIVWLRRKSEDAARYIQEPLDFVYVDGNHDYSHVKRDFQLYYSLLKSGGVIGGHDYGPAELGVVKAVNEFNLSHDVQIQFPDWWIVKGQEKKLCSFVERGLCLNGNGCT